LDLQPLRAEIRALQEKSKAVHFIAFSRNFGKEAALTAGLDHIDADVVVPIDVDLQDPPELIADFVNRWRDGYDVVFGVRSYRASDGLTKRATASVFYRIFNLLSSDTIPPDAGDFRLLDRRVVEVLRQMPERNRFMKGLFAWVGFRSIGVPYTRLERASGTTKLPLRKLWRLALDGITGFSTLPLRVWTYCGLVVASTAFLFGVYRIIRTLIWGVDVPGYASLMVVILFLGGIQLISLGVIGEYLGRLFVEMKQRPLYVVDDKD
jgi:glycosyltransferase involved in cell wall biosynthesis